ncbi:MAG: preprotein translocase subunit SecE [Candidatus Saccharimonadales bacterium]
MVKSTKKKLKEAPIVDESLAKVFWRGFFWPVRMLWRGFIWLMKLIVKVLAWIGHKPPLKQIGHGLRWFFNLRAIKFVGTILLIKYTRDSWRELKQVTWPKWEESRQLTWAVIMFAVVFGALIAVVDYGLDKLFREVLLK